jgi:hypothetical protein
MAALSASRNTPEWSGSTRFHYGLMPVEASTSIYVGGMVAVDGSGNAVPAQAWSGTSTLRHLEVIGICEYIYAGGIMPPGINALNQTGNGSLYPSATGTLGTAGAILIGVAGGVFGMDVDSTIVAPNVGQMCFALDDHTVTLGTLVPNTTSISVPSSGVLINVLGTPHIVPGTFDAYSTSGAGGTHYKEGIDYTVDYQAGLFITISSGAISAGGTAYVTYYHGASKSVAGTIIATDAGLCYVSFMSRAPGYGF